MLDYLRILWYYVCVNNDQETSRSLVLTSFPLHLWHSSHIVAFAFIEFNRMSAWLWHSIYFHCVRCIWNQIMTANPIGVHRVDGNYLSIAYLKRTDLTMMKIKTLQQSFNRFDDVDRSGQFELRASHHLFSFCICSIAKWTNNTNTWNASLKPSSLPRQPTCVHYSFYSSSIYRIKRVLLVSRTFLL